MQQLHATEQSDTARRLFERELNPGELILWSRKAIRAREYASVAYTVVFMCVWVGLPLMSVGRRGSLDDWLFLGPFLATGIVFAIFMVGRQLSQYVALTNRRVLAGSGFLIRNVTSWHVEQWGAIGHSSGIGAGEVWFEGFQVPAGFAAMGISTKGAFRPRLVLPTSSVRRLVELIEEIRTKHFASYSDSADRRSRL